MVLRKVMASCFMGFKSIKNESEVIKILRDRKLFTDFASRTAQEAFEQQ
jgi:hypothetical protein